MQKRLCFVCGILLLLTGCAKQANQNSEVIQAEKTFPADAVYTLNFTATLLYNNSVGDDWQTTYTTDGRAVVMDARLLDKETYATLY